MRNGVVILNYKDSDTTIKLCKDIVRFEAIQKIVIVDNLSPDDSFQKLKTLKSNKVDVIQSDFNGGYSYGNNYGALYLINKYNIEIIFICNPDVIFSNKHIESLTKYLQEYNLQAVSGLMLNSFGNISNWSGKIYSWFEALVDSTLILRRFFIKQDFSYAKREGQFVYVDFLPGSLFAIKADAFIAIGGFDDNVFLYYEEAIIRRKFDHFGFKMALIETETFIHNHSVSINKSINKLNQLKIYYQSKEYFFKHYTNCSRIQNILIKLFDVYGLFIRSIVYRVF